MLVKEFQISGKVDLNTRQLFELEGELIDEIEPLIRIKITPKIVYLEACTTEDKVYSYLQKALKKRNITIKKNKKSSKKDSQKTTPEQKKEFLRGFLKKFPTLSPLLAQVCLRLKEKNIPYRILTGPPSFPPPVGGWKRGAIASVRITFPAGEVDIRNEIQKGAAHVLSSILRLKKNDLQTKEQEIISSLEKVLEVKTEAVKREKTPLGHPRIHIRLCNFPEQLYSTDATRVSYQ